MVLKNAVRHILNKPDFIFTNPFSVFQKFLLKTFEILPQTYGAMYEEHPFVIYKWVLFEKLKQFIQMGIVSCY